MPPLVLRRLHRGSQQKRQGREGGGRFTFVAVLRADDRSIALKTLLLSPVRLVTSAGAIPRRLSLHGRTRSLTKNLSEKPNLKKKPPKIPMKIPLSYEFPTSFTYQKNSLQLKINE